MNDVYDGATPSVCQHPARDIDVLTDGLCILLEIYCNETSPLIDVGTTTSYQGALFHDNSSASK